MPDPVTGTVAGAGLLGGIMSSSGQQSAANTQAGAADRSAQLQKEIADQQIALQREQFNKQIELQQPWRQAGTNALAQMQGGAFAQPEAFRFGAGDYQADPGYAFRLAEGQKALDRQAAARGGLMSGGALKAAQRYGQEMGSQEFGNAYNRALTGYNANVARSDTGYNRLASLAGVGQTATGQLGAAGQNMTSGISNALGSYGQGASNAAINAGQAIAAGQLGAGATYNNALGTMASGYQNQSNFDRFLASQRQPNAGYESRMGVNFLSPNAYD
jgi:hypothetical protein